ncbi:alpha/beta hydrolase family protein [Tahibacter amnicola]|uniref:Prolyl oligopeptidase family serine peptidase n=1 Tax=Tahibacter amnicola TaxID=2976241 RepID=A0ABY6BCY7_9GAMM|nr:prolyl oligopeptidase family serine peptidase [Tahibacter amnicola]UXI67599.1 prolyl oligopeptidase family serine peptidase [Tahibacter amnicola]
MSRRVSAITLALLLLAGCHSPSPSPPTPSDAPASSAQAPATLAQARRGFATALTQRTSAQRPAPTPPAGIFTTIRYPSPAGNLVGYLTPDPGDGQRHPAIIWITGGDNNTIGDVWSEAAPDNDQTAAAYRKAGIVMLFPSQRGGNDHAGPKEGFLGEVDDVIAAAEFLAAQPWVDPARIYLGGHSTGGTLALLTAETTDRFRAVFAFGPVADIVEYGARHVPADLGQARERALRSPLYWLDSIRSPTFVIEGEEGNRDALDQMTARNRNLNNRFLLVKGTDHFATLAPINALIAQKILADTGARSTLTLSQAEVAAPFAR